MKPGQDPYGFRFWLSWIIWFAASFIVTAALWTLTLTFFLGPIRGSELTFTWAAAVFGTWFILLVPFIRKKEQIWKRLNQDEEKSVDAWLMTVGAFVGLLVVSATVWAFVLKSRIQMDPQRMDPLWAKAVFGTWLLLLLPFLVLLYRRADTIFKNAVLRQTAAGPKFRMTLVEKSKRVLPARLSEKIAGAPPTLRQGHIVTLVLKDGSRVPDCFVLNQSEILGVYDRAEFTLNAKDAIDIEVADPEKLPAYEESKWLRLDGRA